jgi:hypothetical protein
MDDGGLIFELLTQILGDPRNHYASKGQASWNCPVCDAERNKGNFEVNYHKDVFQCWSCAETDNTHGSIYKLIKKWGNKEQLSTYVLLRPESIKIREAAIQEKIFMGLPPGFIKFSDGDPNSPQFKQAFKYITDERGISVETIHKYNIGYTVEGKYHHRIIIPSHNVDNEVDYFSARSYNGAKRKYDNPDYPKELIVFNEYYIDWEKDVYLFEGAFDHIAVDNSITMLGKKMSELLWTTLYDKAKANVIIGYDPDAMGNVKKLYKQINTGKLKGRIKALIYRSDHDICELHKRLPPEQFQQLLDSARFISESKL